MPMEGAAFAMFCGSLKNGSLKANMFLSVHIQCRINPCHISAYFWIYHAIIECHCNFSSHFWMQALRVSPRRNIRLRNLSPFARSIHARFLCSHHGLSLGLTGLAPSLGQQHGTTWHNTASFFKSNFAIFL